MSNEYDRDNVVGAITAFVILGGIVAFSFISAANSNPDFSNDLTVLFQCLIPYIFFVGFPLILALVIIAVAKGAAVGSRIHLDLLKSDAEPVAVKKMKTVRREYSKRLPALKK